MSRFDNRGGKGDSWVCERELLEYHSLTRDADFEFI